MGKKDNLDRKHWLAFADHCQLPERAAARVLAAQAAALPETLDLLERCFLPAEQKVEYHELLEERTARLAPSGVEPSVTTRRPLSRTRLQTSSRTP